ncbi:apolipoprotein N-acyltransferase [Chlorobium sp. N1]|uniref:apolipoprotein N-acyltransferase n=1 Tax=Chlorobium sp. N1 TaxID=2491138 RepID=UPI00103D4046|nr:apolipoprotein N-acyltransferase [Chlorobium sp. N1]TCD48657.1 apolipoprotein N-acyltransferase [Chlorobium sp. N1]
MTVFPSTAGRFRRSPYLPPLLSGILLALAFPSYPSIHFELLAWVALVPLLHSIAPDPSARSVFLKTFLAMLAYSAGALWWVCLATLPGGLLTILAEALFLSVPFMLFFMAARLWGVRPALLSFPFLLTGWEWLYMQQELSLGWLTLGNSQANLLLMVQYADITGVWGISFWLAAFNVLVLFLLLDGRRRLSRYAPVLLLMVLVPMAYGFLRLHSPREAAEGGMLRVSLVQPDIDPFEKWQRYTSRETLELYYLLSDRAVMQSRPELVVWPETALPFYILDDGYGDYLLSLRRSLRLWRVSLLTGFSDIVYADPGERPPSAGPGRFDRASGRYFEVFNATMLLTPGGEEPQIYRKSNLVPFAERVPYSGYFPVLERLAFSLAGVGSWGRGPGPALMELPREGRANVKLANIICYESIFPGYVSRFVSLGAELLTLVTNDGWYGTSYGPWQHLAIGRLRCIENRRAMARCANTGVTECIDPFGRTIASLPWWEARVLNAEVPLGRNMSFYTRHPDLLAKASVVVSLLVVGGGWVRRIVFRGRRS